MAFDLYDYEKHKFFPAFDAIAILRSCDFCTVSVLEYEHPLTYSQLDEMLAKPSAFSSTATEGIYIKLSDKEEITHRFKILRPDFVQGGLWDKNKLKRNQLGG